MGCPISPATCDDAACAYRLLLDALALIPARHYLLALSIVAAASLYNVLGFHFLEDAFSGFRGARVELTRCSCSGLYDCVVAKCTVLHGRYMATPWLSSPHVQTCFLNFWRPPGLGFSYRRQLFTASDGGSIALDWLLSSDVNGIMCKKVEAPIVVVIPGLLSDSSSSYIRHFAFKTSRRGWHIVVSNHRGHGGVSVTSDCFYNAGWTEDVRAVVDYLRQEYPRAPLFLVGTSIGANILVKYLGEEKETAPVAGAVAVCCPWDLLLGDRYLCRGLMQKFYDRALTIGLRSYAELYQPHFSRLANWEGIAKSQSIRDFDNHATCLLGKFETVDTYYRRCSSAGYIGNVSVPLLCISALDDPVCAKEAIPWDECRINKNVVLATLKHGGHLAFFEGINGASLWWVRAADEFLDVLYCSPYMNVKKKSCCNDSLSKSSIDQGTYVNVTDGMVAAMGNEHSRHAFQDNLTEPAGHKAKDITEDTSNNAKEISKEASSQDAEATLQLSWSRDP